MQEDRILAKLYQIPDFGVKVPKEIDLNRARSLPTAPRLDYLHSKIKVETLIKAYTAFSKHLQDTNTKIFWGDFGDKFENEVYSGFYAHNLVTDNMMFFRKNPQVDRDYSLHGYMKLNRTKSKELDKKHSIF